MPRRRGPAARSPRFTPESDRVGAQMARIRPDYMIHLGDVYYAGMPEEERRYVERWPGDPR
jgi:phosphodiesterase/alkaline phosphatase D-like protein